MSSVFPINHHLAPVRSGLEVSLPLVPTRPLRSSSFSNSVKVLPDMSETENGDQHGQDETFKVSLLKIDPTRYTET